MGANHPKRPERRADEEGKDGGAAAGKESLRAAGILIKHEGSRRRASWKNPEGRVISATTATARLGELRD